LIVTDHLAVDNDTVVTESSLDADRRNETSPVAHHGDKIVHY
jgi:hypothetical protein